jgi:hypothetical protein
MKTRLLPVALALVAVSVTSTLGCKRLAEKAEEKAIERSTGGQVTINDKKGTLTIVTDAGAMTMGATTKIPDDFPKAVAVYPNAKPNFAAKSLDPKGKEVWSLTFETSDTKEQVLAYYKANMSGFTQATSMDMGQSSMNVYQSPKYDVTLMVSGVSSGSSAKTGITLNAVTK